MPFAPSLRGFLGAAALVNAVPHGYAAITGQPFPSPFGDPPGRGNSAPPVDAAWSLTNVVASHFLGGSRRGVRPPVTSVILGGFVMAVGLAYFFGPDGPSSPFRRR